MSGSWTLECPFGHSKLTALPTLNRKPGMSSQRTVPVRGFSSSSASTMAQRGHVASVVTWATGSVDTRVTPEVILQLSAVDSSDCTEDLRELSPFLHIGHSQPTPSPSPSNFGSHP